MENINKLIEQNFGLFMFIVAVTCLVSIQKVQSTALNIIREKNIDNNALYETDKGIQENYVDAAEIIALLTVEQEVEIVVDNKVVEKDKYGNYIISFSNLSSLYLKEYQYDNNGTIKKILFKKHPSIT